MEHDFGTPARAKARQKLTTIDIFFLTPDLDD
jgi:hypothetical protein